ncbi:MAG: AbrB family transcriptional regulator [Pseudomonadota bacterium]
MQLKTILLSIAALSLGGATGHLLAQFPVPLPYLLGAMLANAIGVFVLPQKLIEGFRIPEVLRQPFIACIGLFIGAQVHLEMITDWTSVLALLAALTLFTPVVFAANYLLFRRLGRYDPATAFFAGSPGGLIEAIELGSEAGAQAPTLIMQQFLRIIIVVSLVPFAMSLWVGHPVGSAAGMPVSDPQTQSPLWIILAIAAPGYLLGKAARLPAGQLTGPLIVAALLGTTGLIQLHLPGWLIILAQIVISAALGLRFNGISAGLLRKGAQLGLASVTLMLGIGALLTAALIQWLPLSGSAALLSFAPGGVTEMALVALSIAADPAIVTLAHVYRIVLTVIILTLMCRRFNRPPFPPK